MKEGFEHTIERVVPVASGATGEFRAGAAEKDITPHFGLAMAGYSTEGKLARGVSGRLFARALVLEGTNGSRVCICILDLMSGTRYLLEEIARRTAATCGITVDQLVLAGSHTHNGPGRIYGNTLYDTFAQRRSGFDRPLADWLAGQIASTIDAASQAVEPALVALGEERLWGVTKNRSLPAFPLGDWNDAGSPGENPPGDLKDEQKAVDPRVHVVAAYRAADSQPIATFAFFGCHYTAMGAGAKYYSSDAAGYAVRRARWALENRPGGARVVVAVGAGATGDVNTLRKDLDPEIGTGIDLAEWVGDRLGGAIADRTLSMMPAAGAVPIETRFCDPDHGDSAPGNGNQTELPDRWFFGAPVLAGSEESRTLFYHLHLVREGMRGRDFPSDHPQYPKARALGPIQRPLMKLLKLKPSSAYPIHQIRLGSTILATLPGEPTTATARTIEVALQAETGASKVLVVGYTGDYGGYFTTEAEHSKQYYEGASTLYGRHVVDYLEGFHLWLSRQAPSLPAGGSVRFASFTEDKGFHAESVGLAGLDPRPRITREGQQVDLRWRMRPGTRLVLAERALVSIEEKVGSSWTTLDHEGRPFDDVWQPVHIRVRPPRLFGRGERWNAQFVLPEDSAKKHLRVRVSAWGDFPGFVEPIPE